MNKIAELTGLSAVPEDASGEIIVLDQNNTANCSIVTGKIVVIRIASPSIVVWLRKARGLLVETGGPTCHAAIFARELNIPCIVGVNGIYNNDYNGLKCALNGASGKVLIYGKE